MVSFKTKGFFSKLYSWMPILILLISVLNEFDVNYLNLKYFSFNFPFILIFFFTLKEFKHFDYFFVFLAGLINDTVVGLPLGMSSLSYILICIATSYFRNITIRPNPIKDWFYFLFIISLINSINYSILTLSDKNRIREWKLAPVRGEFHDYFGNIIAGNFEAYQLHVIPEQVEDFRYVIYRLKDLLELSDKEFKKVLKKKRSNHGKH